MAVDLTTLKEFLVGLTPISNPASAGLGTDFIMIWAMNVGQYPGSYSYTVTWYQKLISNGQELQYGEISADLSAHDLENGTTWWANRGESYFGSREVRRLNPLTINLTSSATLGTSV